MDQHDLQVIKNIMKYGSEDAPPEAKAKIDPRSAKASASRMEDAIRDVRARRKPESEKITKLRALIHEALTYVDQDETDGEFDAAAEDLEDEEDDQPAIG